MRTPGFWSRRGLAARGLAPLGAVTRTLTARRVARAGFSPGIPVFCAGNAGAGGAGKTILALDLLGRLPGTPFALTRGYGGRLRGPVLIDLASHSPKDIGDEALLLAAAAPTILARDRAAGARFARGLGASAIVMDDGLQNPGLVKDCALLVIDGGYGFGNLLLLPAGPLREPVAAAASRCRAAVLIGADETDAAAALPDFLPVLRAELTPHCTADLRGRDVIAFAGIGRPAKFFATAASLGANIVGRRGFADHHVYTAADARSLLAEATAARASLVCTAKDFVKLPPALQAASQVITVRLDWQDEAALTRLIGETL